MRAQPPPWVEPLDRRICFSDGSGGAAGEFVDVVDHPYLPLIPGATYIYRGADADGLPLRSRVTVTGQSHEIDGITATVVRQRTYRAGGLIEDERAYFAQDRDGNVWRVDGAAREIVMPAQPAAANVLAVGRRVRVPFGTFADCVLTTTGEAGQNCYAPGIGLIVSQALSDNSGGAIGTRGAETLRLAYVDLAPESFADRVDHPYFPLTPGTTLIYRGHDNGVATRQRVTISGETPIIAGVRATLVRVREYVEGELVEDTRDYYAQDKAGNVWYFGEDSRQYEDGELVGSEGSWLAGADDARPGIFMPAHPSVGDRFHLEMRPGVAEDQAEVLAAFQTIRVPYGTVRDVIHLLDFSLLEPDDAEHKFYAPGIGFVLEVSADGEDNENIKLAYVLIEEPQ